MTREAAHCLWRLTRLDYLLSCLPSGPTVRGLRQRPRRRVTESGTARSLGVPASASLSSPSNLPGGVGGAGPRLLHSYPRVSTLASSPALGVVRPLASARGGCVEASPCDVSVRCHGSLFTVLLAFRFSREASANL